MTGNNHLELPPLPEAPGDRVDYMSFYAPLPTVIAVATFLQPHFIEVRGCTLLPWMYDEANFDAWWQSTDGEVRAIEGVLNHTHLYDLFMNQKMTDESTLGELGALIVRSWRGALADQFPGRAFEVSLVDDPDEYGPTVYLVSAADQPAARGA